MASSDGRVFFQVRRADGTTLKLTWKPILLTVAAACGWVLLKLLSDCVNHRYGLLPPQASRTSAPLLFIFANE